MTFDEIVQAIEARLAWLPAWSVSLLLFAFAFGLALTIHRIAYEIMTRVVAS